MELPPRAESQAFASLIKRACVKASLQLHKTINTRENAGVTPELALVLAMAELTPDEVDVTPAMRDAGEKVILNRWDCDAYVKATAGEVVEAVYRAMVAAREGSI